MRTILILLLTVVLTGRCVAADSKKEADQLKQMVAEIDARRVVREHESGKKKATGEQLAAAQAIIRQSEERKAREVAPGPNGSFAVEFKDSDMKSVQSVCGGVYGGNVVIGLRIMGRKISLSAAALSLDEFRKKLQAEFERQGIYFIYRPDAMILDLERDSYKYPMHAK